MKNVCGMILAVFMVGCATTPMNERRKEVIECVIKLKREEFKEGNSFAICSRTYGIQSKQVEEKELSLGDEPSPTPGPSPTK